MGSLAGTDGKNKRDGWMDPCGKDDWKEKNCEKI